MSFGIALSGINAAQSDLNVTANNIANSNTTGFKQSRSEFAELFAVSPQGVSKTQNGAGVKIANSCPAVHPGQHRGHQQQPRSGDQRQGFFILSNAGALPPTRVPVPSRPTTPATWSTPRGSDCRSIRRPARVVSIPPRSSDLRLVTGDSAPSPTTTADLSFNLPANVSPPAVATFDPANSNSYNNSTSMTVYDSLGAVHTASMYFVKTATTNTWDTRLYIDGTAVGGAQTLTYSNLGALTVPVGGKITFPTYTPGTGAAGLDLTINYATSTQYGDTFGVTCGHAGRLYDRPADRHQRRFHAASCRRASPTGARSRSARWRWRISPTPQGLQSLGNTNWAETFSSGQVLHGQAGNSGFGLIQSGSLEQSNVEHHRAAGQHDHRAAQLPGQRADDLDRKSDHADDHQHPLIPGAKELPWIVWFMWPCRARRKPCVPRPPTTTTWPTPAPPASAPTCRRSRARRCRARACRRASMPPTARWAGIPPAASCSRPGATSTWPSTARAGSPCRAPMAARPTPAPAICASTSTASWSRPPAARCSATADPIAVPPHARDQHRP